MDKTVSGNLVTSVTANNDLLSTSIPTRDLTTNDIEIENEFNNDIIIENMTNIHLSNAHSDLIQIWKSSNNDIDKQFKNYNV